MTTRVPWIHVLQGERELARDTARSAIFDSSWALRQPRAAWRRSMSASTLINGILTVTARDKTTGKEQSITISGLPQLSKEEIDRMVSDAQRHAAEDRQQREAVEARNQADTVAYQVERQLYELGDRAPMHERARAERHDSADSSAGEGPIHDMARLGSCRVTCNSAGHRPGREQLYQGDGRDCERCGPGWSATWWYR